PGTELLDSDVLRIPAWRWVFRIHAHKSGADDRCNGGVPNPFPIGRDHIPRRPFGGAALEHGFVSRLELFPRFPVLKILGIELPTFRRGRLRDPASVSPVPPSRYA